MKHSEWGLRLNHDVTTSDRSDWVSSCVDHRLTFLRRPGTQRRVVLIFYVHFAPAGLLFFRNLFSPFIFVTSRDILQKKDPSSLVGNSAGIPPEFRGIPVSGLFLGRKNSLRL